MRFLSYGRVVDTTRMKDVLGFTPRYSTREAFDDFVAGRGCTARCRPTSSVPSRAGSRRARSRGEQVRRIELGCLTRG